jgi:hypothetical protein
MHALISCMASSSSTTCPSATLALHKWPGFRSPLPLLLLLLLLLQGELIINEDLNVYDITHSSVQVSTFADVLHGYLNAPAAQQVQQDVCWSATWQTHPYIP